MPPRCARSYTYVDRTEEYPILANMPMPKFRLRGNRRLSDAVMASLGKLEHQAMGEIRLREEASVRQIWETMGGSIAYTTLMTTLDRLYKKGLLKRRKAGRAFLYSAKFSVGEMERSVAGEVIGTLLDNNIGPAEPVLACIVNAVSDRDRMLLDDLERLVREKRREMDARK